jgi:hypothetical protein
MEGSTDRTVLNIINAPGKDPVKVVDLVGWLSGSLPVGAGRASSAIFSFFTEVPPAHRSLFLHDHRIEESAAKRVSDEWIENGREAASRVAAHASEEEKRSLSLAMTLRRLRSAKSTQSDIKSNSEPWISERPRSVAEAIALSDRIESGIREWRER